MVLNRLARQEEPAAPLPRRRTGTMHRAVACTAVAWEALDLLLPARNGLIAAPSARSIRHLAVGGGSGWWHGRRGSNADSGAPRTKSINRAPIKDPHTPRASARRTPERQAPLQPRRSLIDCASIAAQPQRPLREPDPLLPPMTHGQNLIDHPHNAALSTAYRVRSSAASRAPLSTLTTLAYWRTRAKPPWSDDCMVLAWRHDDSLHPRRVR